MPKGSTFYNLLGQRYTDFEDKLDLDSPDDSRQLWHTPTELFRPYYGEAIARYLVTNYKLNYHPYHDLIIYEIGAGNGTMMLNVLDYIRDLHPEVYERTKFKVIEISSALASLQSSQLRRSASSRGHTDHVEIINRSIFTWDTYVPAPCYFLALEVFDNFAHDAIRYDHVTEEPLQSMVLIDDHGDFHEVYTKKIDPVATRYLRMRNAVCSHSFNHPLKYSRFFRKIKASLPFTGNLTVPEYIPTRLMQFFDILQANFPLHQLVTSDFHYLPQAIKGVNAPVVQTRYQRHVVAVRTPFVSQILYLQDYPTCATQSPILPRGTLHIFNHLDIINPQLIRHQVKQGYFDILFPTDFTVMEDIYRAITGKLTKVLSHEEFLRRWSYVEDTETQNGENPLLSWYANASVMTTI